MSMLTDFLISYVPSFPSDPAWWFFVLPNLIVNAGSAVLVLKGNDRAARMLLQVACWPLVGFLIVHTLALQQWAMWIKGVDLSNDAICLWRSPHGYILAELYGLLGACGLACLGALPASVMSMSKSLAGAKRNWTWTLLLLTSAGTLIWCRWELFRYAYPAIIHLGGR